MKKLFIFFMLVIAYFCSYASDRFVMSDEVNYDIEFMKDGDSPDNFELYSNIIELEKKFLNNCEKITDGEDFLGEWILVDDNQTPQNVVSYNLCNLTNIIKLDRYYVLDNYGNRSFIYRNNNGRLYIYTRWINIIRMFEIIDDKLYFYIIQNNKWILDPIHKEGRFYFVRKWEEVEYIRKIYEYIYRGTDAEICHEESLRDVLSRTQEASAIEDVLADVESYIPEENRETVLETWKVKYM